MLDTEMKGVWIGMEYKIDLPKGFEVGLEYMEKLRNVKVGFRGFKTVVVAACGFSNFYVFN